MKPLWIIFILILSVSGCDIKEEVERRKNLHDSSTISESFYLLTVLHDEHLFIIRDNCGIFHHPNCPCFKNMQPEKQDQESSPPIIFINPLK